MLVIRRSQQDVLGACCEAALVRKIMSVVSKMDGACSSHDPEALFQIVTNSVSRARSHYGLRTTASIADYVGLSIELGINFDEDATVAEIFNCTEEPVERRLTRIFEELSDDDWIRLRKA